MKRQRSTYQQARLPTSGSTPMTPSQSASREDRGQRSGMSTTTSTSTSCQAMERSSLDTLTRQFSTPSTPRYETGQCLEQPPNLRSRSRRRYSQQSHAPRWSALRTPERRLLWRLSASPVPSPAETRLSRSKDTTTDTTTTYSSASSHPQPYQASN